MNKFSIAVLAGLVFCAAGCSKKPSEAELNAEIQARWQACKLVRVLPVSITESSGSTVRFSYKVILLKDGAAAKPSDCPSKTSTLLAAMANADLVDLKANSEVAFTEERRK